MNEEELAELYRTQAARTFLAIERIRVCVLVMYVGFVGLLLLTWPPSAWMLLILVLETAVLIYLFVRCFPRYSLGHVISEDDEE